jgi:glutaredoxin
MYTIWGRPGCKWCDEAKKLLTYHFIEYEYVELNADTLQEFQATFGDVKTVPQIVAEKFYPEVGWSLIIIGGYDDLVNFLKAKAID